MQLSSKHQKGFAIHDELGCSPAFLEVWNASRQGRRSHQEGSQLPAIRYLGGAFNPI
jgi:hypothetical protein